MTIFCVLLGGNFLKFSGAFGAFFMIFLLFLGPCGALFATFLASLAESFLVSLPAGGQEVVLGRNPAPRNTQWGEGQRCPWDDSISVLGPPAFPVGAEGGQE